MYSGLVGLGFLNTASLAGDGHRKINDTKVKVYVCVSVCLHGLVILNCPYMGTVMKACPHIPSLQQRMNDLMFWKERKKKAAEHGADHCLQPDS